MKQKNKPIRLSELPLEAGKSFLICDKCGQKNSAKRGDYTYLPEDHLMMCCHFNVRLVEESNAK